MASRFCVAVLLLLPGDGPASDPWRDALRLLSSKQIPARVHQSLLERYGASNELILQGEQPYTLHDIPVSLGLDEEWPAVLSGSRYLLEEPLHSDLIATCRRIRAEAPERRGTLQQVLLQSELWAAFDQLYLEGSRPPGLTGPRWTALLRELALTIRHVAPSGAEIRALHADAGELRRRALAAVGGTSAVEFYSLQRPSIHDVAHQFRRVNRFFYTDSRLQTLPPSVDTLRALRERKLPLPEGSAALIEECAIVVTRDLGLMETPVPLTFKAYRRLPSTAGKDLDFWMARLNGGARRLGADALRPLPAETEAWARIDLPNIPGAHGKPAFRAPLGVACAGCHGRYPKAFAPGAAEFDEQYFRLSTEAQTFTADRVMDLKCASAEYATLRAHLEEEGAPERPGFRLGGISWICLAGLAFSAAMAAFLRARPAKGLPSPRPSA